MRLGAQTTVSGAKTGGRKGMTGAKAGAADAKAGALGAKAGAADMTARAGTLRARLSLAIAVVVLLAVLMICLLSNILLERQFERYARAQQEAHVGDIAQNLSMLYYPVTAMWDTDAIHALGMYSMADGYILTVRDKEGMVVWDAQNHDMARCEGIMNEIALRMGAYGTDGGFVARDVPIEQNGASIGTVSVSAYGPFFFSEADAALLGALNRILLAVGIMALVAAIFVGWVLARRVARPALAAAETAERIAAGDYAARMDARAGITELDELAGAINRLAADLGEQQILRRQLTADVAHELRTPLAALSVQFELMAEGAAAPAPTRLRQCFEEIKRLASLVADLEKLERAEARAGLRLGAADAGRTETADAGRTGAAEAVRTETAEAVRTGAAEAVRTETADASRTGLRTERVDIEALVRSVCGTWEGECAAKRIHLAVRADVEGGVEGVTEPSTEAARGEPAAAPQSAYLAEVDKDLLAGAMSNLLSNAVKYTPEGGAVTVTLSARTRDENTPSPANQASPSTLSTRARDENGRAAFGAPRRIGARDISDAQAASPAADIQIDAQDASPAADIHIEVRDTGSGVPEGELPYIFERFYRADKSRNRETGGSGIGLAIAREAILAHGGSIFAENCREGGCAFTIILPARQ
jgi:signal transduction histidine kinase